MTTTYDLTHRVTIQYNAAAGTTDANYEKASQDWRTLATVFASRKGVRGSLLFAAAMQGHEDDEVFTIYWRNDVKAFMRFVEGPLDDHGQPEAGAEVFQLKVPPFDPDGMRMWLQCNCRRMTGGGG